MLRFTSALPDDWEPAIVWWGQSNSRPWGSKAEGFSQAPHLDRTNRSGLSVAVNAIVTAPSSIALVGLSSPTTLTTDEWKGAMLRLTAKRGVTGTSTSTSSTGLGVAGTPWVVNAYVGQIVSSGSSYGVIASNTSSVLSLDLNGWIGGTPATGAFTVQDIVGYATILSNTNNALTVKWYSAAATPPGLPSAGNGVGMVVSADITRDDDRFKYYETVRILTPYQPELLNTDPAGPQIPYPSGPVVVPGYTIPSNITSYADLGLFLNYTFLEGIEGQGAIGSGTATSTTFTDGTGALIVNSLAGGYIRAGNSRARIASNTATVLTLDAAGWVGGTPAGTVNYQAWVGHHANTPHAWAPGDGFRYPNNDMMPSAFAQGSQGVIHNRARGDNALGGSGTPSSIFDQYSYGDRFGAILEFAYRLSTMIGRRVNIIHLGVNSSGQILRNVQNRFGFFGQIGWFDYNKNLDWTPGDPDSNASRMARLIQVIAPAAMQAEGNTRKLKVLGIVGLQGEADCLVEVGRHTYGYSLNTFYTWLRKLITDAGMNPYTADAKIPVCHAPISHIPYELNGTFTYYGLQFQLSGDDQKLVNAAISDFVARDGFACSFTVDNPDGTALAPKLLIDPLHYNGVGEAMNGRAIAESLIQVIERALGQGLGIGSVDIANLALSHIGSQAKVTSVDPPDGTAEAALVAKFFPLARDMLLQRRQWGFATRKVALTAVTNTNAQWQYAYAVPADALNVFAVLDANAQSDEIQTLSDAAPAPYIAVPTFSVNSPQQFTIEHDDSGNRILYTNQQDAILRYGARTIDPTMWPPLFRAAMSWQLASMLAGPIVKGQEGSEQSQRCLQMAAMTMGEAAASDGNQRRVVPTKVASSISARG